MVASWSFVIGGITMPLCCLVMAHFSKMRMVFAVPVLSLLTGAVLTLAILLPAKPCLTMVPPLEHQLSAVNQP
jgi:hypothetical protein